MAALVAALIGTSVAAAPDVADAATTISYCGQWVSPRTRCPVDTPRHTYNTNYVEGFTYFLGGQLNWYSAKCERMTAWDDYETIFSRRCGSARGITGQWDDFCGNCQQYENTGILLKVYVGNDEPYNDQKVYGKGAY